MPGSRHADLLRALRAALGDVAVRVPDALVDSTQAPDQIATHLWTPSTETWSTTYSVPFMNSCTKTLSLLSPKTVSVPSISLKRCWHSCRLLAI